MAAWDVQFELQANSSQKRHSHRVRKRLDLHRDNPLRGYIKVAHWSELQRTRTVQMLPTLPPELLRTIVVAVLEDAVGLEAAFLLSGDGGGVVAENAVATGGDPTRSFSPEAAAMETLERSLQSTEDRIGRPRAGIVELLLASSVLFETAASILWRNHAALTQCALERLRTSELQARRLALFAGAFQRALRERRRARSGEAERNGRGWRARLYLESMKVLDLDLTRVDSLDDLVLLPNVARVINSAGQAVPVPVLQACLLRPRVLTALGLVAPRVDAINAISAFIDLVYLSISSRRFKRMISNELDPFEYIGMSTEEEEALGRALDALGGFGKLRRLHVYFCSPKWESGSGSFSDGSKWTGRLASLSSKLTHLSIHSVHPVYIPQDVQFPHLLSLDMSTQIPRDNRETSALRAKVSVLDLVQRQTVACATRWQRLNLGWYAVATTDAWPRLAQLLLQSAPSSSTLSIADLTELDLGEGWGDTGPRLALPLADLDRILAATRRLRVLRLRRVRFVGPAPAWTSGRSEVSLGSGDLDLLTLVGEVLGQARGRLIELGICDDEGNLISLLDAVAARPWPRLEVLCVSYDNMDVNERQAVYRGFVERGAFPVVREVYMGSTDWIEGPPEQHDGPSDSRFPVVGSFFTAFPHIRVFFTEAAWEARRDLSWRLWARVWG
ncbi:hypothetical protein HK405_009593 [Cladochytrium tenue]|nr:hypothetical protein HK405_009593 [Cladochytrium tenue]